jgi:hypothetical protein
MYLSLADWASWKESIPSRKERSSKLAPVEGALGVAALFFSSANLAALAAAAFYSSANLSALAAAAFYSLANLAALASAAFFSLANLTALALATFFFSSASLARF